MDGLDLKKLAAEVSAIHGIRIDADDPIMAVITLNRLVFEQAVERAVERLQASADEIDRAAVRVQVRVGASIAHELKQYVADFEQQTRSVMDRLIDAATKHRTRIITAVTAREIALILTVAALFFSLGVHVGMQIAGRCLSGG